MAREAGHLKSDAVTYLKGSILQDPATLLQLFCLNCDFAGPWQVFTTAADDASRTSSPTG